MVSAPGQKRAASARARSSTVAPRPTRLVEAAHEHRDATVGRPPLEREERFQPIRPRRGHPDAVDGVGREGHDRAAGQELGRARDPLGGRAGSRSVIEAGRCARPGRARRGPARPRRTRRSAPGREPRRPGRRPARGRPSLPVRRGAARRRAGGAAGRARPGRRRARPAARSRAIRPCASTSALGTYGRLAVTTSGRGSRSPAGASRSAVSSVTASATPCAARFSAASASASVETSLATSRSRPSATSRRKSRASARAMAPDPVATSQATVVGCRESRDGDLRGGGRDDELRLGPGDQGARIGSDPQRAPLLEAADVGDRLSRRPAVDRAR